MSRRFASLLVAWFSLFSVAMPAITCASAIQHHDCCPEKAKPPCGECPDQAPASGTSPNHCLIAPAQVAATALTQDQVRKDFQPDLVPAALPPAPLSPVLRASNSEPTRSRWRPLHDDAEIPAYLLTGRLRL